MAKLSASEIKKRIRDYLSNQQIEKIEVKPGIYFYSPENWHYLFEVYFAIELEDTRVEAKFSLLESFDLQLAIDGEAFESFDEISEDEFKKLFEDVATCSYLEISYSTRTLREPKAFEVLVERYRDEQKAVQLQRWPLKLGTVQVVDIASPCYKASEMEPVFALFPDLRAENRFLFTPRDGTNEIGVVVTRFSESITQHNREIFIEKLTRMIKKCNVVELSGEGKNDETLKEICRLAEVGSIK